MKPPLIILVCLVALPAWADPVRGDDTTYEAAPDLDLDRSWLDPAELVKVVSYDSVNRIYEVSKIEDPTILKIYTSVENLARAVPSLNLTILKDNPAVIVGRQYELDRELVLVEPSSAKNSLSANAR